ncbi:MAG: hypothetical protein DRI90_09635 [Deltaproteobacteria bacterium]|nr:MAG: hypothetical protein DRI90_09635 [Deltaproteobacteria bacterium]
MSMPSIANLRLVVGTESAVAVAVLALALATGCGSSDEGGGGQASSSSSSGAGGECGFTGSSACSWPSGVNFGIDEGKTLGPGFEWEGYAEGCPTPSTISIADFYDCDGSRGINAIYLSSSRFNCSGCAQESSEMQAKIDGSWGALGIKVIFAIIQSDDDGPPTIDDVLTYKSQYGLDDATLIADPSMSFLIGATITTPHITIVNPRNMEVTAVQTGYPGPYAAAENLAQQNASN